MATILLTLDGSAFAEQAIPHALGRLGPDDELLVLRVVNPAPTLRAPESIVTEVDLAGSEEYLQQMGRRLAERCRKARTALRIGPPRETILEVAAEENVSLIVIASHGRTGIARWVMDSVAESVTRQAPCPVWLVRCLPLPEYTLREPWEEEAARIERILVPLDNSERSEQALEFVTATFDKAPVTLLLLTATNLAWLGQTDLGGEIVAEMRANLESQAEKLRARGWRVEVSLDPSAPAAAILDNATDWRADLIVMTSHGRTGTDRWFLGSVAEKVARHAHCPVAVVRTAPVEAAVPA